MPNEADVIARVCAELARDRTADAASVIRSEYPFVPATVTSRDCGPLDATRVFVRDGFVDRYSGRRLVFPAVLRILSALMPVEFPFHPNWRTDVTHRAYWVLQPTIDHLVPVTHGGADEPANWVTTCQVLNSAKGNWTLEELGWHLHPPGDVREWDGMMGWALRYAAAHPAVASGSSVRTWIRAAQRVMAERE